MRLALIFDKTRADTTGGYFERAGQALGLRLERWRARDVGKIPASSDAYLRIDHGDDYDLRLPERLRPAAFYAIDTHLRHSWKKIRRMAPWYDVVFCAQAEAARRLPNGEWLPLACDPALHRLPMMSAPVWDLGFVGTDGGHPRKFYLQALRERYPNSVIGMADYTQMASIYGRARIGFNYSIADDVNMRIFEVLAGGALLVTNALAHDDLARLGLEDGRHLALYRSPRRLVEVIDYYLAPAHDAQRLAIARAGGAIALERHTYAHRLQQLLRRLSQRVGRPTGSRVASQAAGDLQSPHRMEVPSCASS